VTVAVRASVVTLIAAVILLPAAAYAQAPATAPPGLRSAPAGPGPNVGGVVFLVVSAIIVGGAIVLYLRHRRPRVHN
jgi:hypothetical protein